MTDEELMVALELDDSYEAVRVLARTALGTTELVLSEDNRLLVRKRIPRALANRDAWEALAGIRHPQLPYVECIYELPDELVVVCEYVAGQTVREMIERHDLLEVDEAVLVAMGLCDAAAALHAAGIVHRDISPGNVIIRCEVQYGSIRGRTCLIDLGVARLHDEDARRDTKPLGTWGFAAPEQYGFAQSDARSDVYAIGRMLVCLLRGRMPVQGEDDLGQSGLQDLPEPLRDIIERACAFEPSARYQTVAELGEALSGVAPTESSYAGVARAEVVADAPPKGLWERLLFLHRQPLTWRRVLVQAVLLVGVLWAVLLILADMITWANPKSSRYLAGSAAGPVVSIASLVAAWFVLRHYTDNVVQPGRRSPISLVLLLAATFVVMLAVIVAVVMIAMFALGELGQ